MQGPVSKLPKARFPCKCQLFPYLEKADPGLFYFRRQRARRTCLHVHLAVLCAGGTRLAPTEVERRPAARV